MIFIFVGLLLFLLAVPVFGNTLSEIVLQATHNSNILQFINNHKKILAGFNYQRIRIYEYLRITISNKKENNWNVEGTRRTQKKS